MFRSEELQQELATIREEYSSTVRNMQNKHDANVEYLKQDQKVTSTKVLIAFPLIFFFVIAQFW